tara:strand:+ start:414 stop:737 length:324 start_codon:yes stop_codon:yes gene_type:complete
MRSTWADYVTAIESAWFERTRQETLYLYHMPVETFWLLDDPGPQHYASLEAIVLTDVTVVDDLLGALVEKGGEPRVTPSLWPQRDRVVNSTTQFSCYRMRNAHPPPE